MNISSTLPCRFSCDTKRFGTVYYFLKPNNHGEGATYTTKISDLSELIGTYTN